MKWYICIMNSATHTNHEAKEATVTLHSSTLTTAIHTTASGRQVKAIECSCGRPILATDTINAMLDSGAASINCQCGNEVILEPVA